MLVHQTMIINFILSIVWIIYMTLFYKILKHISSSVRVTKWSKLIFSLRCERSRVRFPLDSRSLVKPIHMKSSMVFIRKLVILSRCVIVQSSYGSTSRKLQHKLWLWIWKAEYMLFQIKKCLPKSTPWKVVILGVKVAILMKNR